MTAPCFLKVVTPSIRVHAQVGGGCRPGAHALRQSWEWRRCISLPNYAQFLLWAVTCLKLIQPTRGRVRCDRADAGYPAVCSDGAATKRRKFHVGKRALKCGMDLGGNLSCMCQSCTITAAAAGQEQLHGDNVHPNSDAERACHSTLPRCA